MLVLFSANKFFSLTSQKKILLLDTSLHNFEQGNELFSYQNMQSTHATNPAVSPQVLHDAGRQDEAAAENLSQNGDLSHSHSSFEFSGENSSSARSHADTLARSSSRSEQIPSAGQPAQTAASPAGSGTRAR
jgi:hypothetical protein